MEFCFVLNECLRDDSGALVDPAAQIVPAINQLCVTANFFKQKTAYEIALIVSRTTN
eukprot:SAG31_NODE_34153_length_336_cov_0.586498_2_plen_56_part_01